MVACVVGSVEVVRHHSARVIVEINALVQKFDEVDGQKRKNRGKELELGDRDLEEADALLSLQ